MFNPPNGVDDTLAAKSGGAPFHTHGVILHTLVHGAKLWLTLDEPADRAAVESDKTPLAARLAAPAKTATRCRCCAARRSAYSAPAT